MSACAREKVTTGPAEAGSAVTKADACIIHASPRLEICGSSATVLAESMNRHCSATIERLKCLRRAVLSRLPEVTRPHLQALRLAELERVMPLFPPAPLRLLEVGAGAGWQARELAVRGYEVAAVELPEAVEPSPAWPVVVYDGRRLPFATGSADVVFSSNVLEHVSDLAGLLGEVERVLASGGVAVHVVPSASWRMWSMLTEAIRYTSVPAPHGARARTCFQEVRLFLRTHWEGQFRAHGWQVLESRGNDLFYTGASLLDRHLSVRRRRGLSRVLGSACHLFVTATRKG